jgi:hypothetical protein
VKGEHSCCVATEQLICARSVGWKAATPKTDLSILGDNLRLNRSKTLIIAGGWREITAHLAAIRQSETSSDNEHSVRWIESAGERIRSNRGLVLIWLALLVDSELPRWR